ncbi:MAG: hypothetical protein GXO45_01270 [Aquificae bacterium]|nr:hypothetical protein [Aquificota bacterium]
MKKVLPALLIATSVYAQDIKDPLLKKLYEKGILTEEEVAQLEKERKETPIFSVSDKIKFGGKAYIGYTYTDIKDGTDEGGFEIRRGYFITKYYFNQKDYLRFTFDITWQYHKENIDEGKELDIKVKHLYLNKDISQYIPNTQFELGIVHTPWLDYEEHSGWWFRSVVKTFYEWEDGAHLLPSADAGIDFKTKFDRFSAEYGVFDGEGYDHLGRKDKGDSGNKPMVEGRATLHLLGGGMKKPNPIKDQYLNISAHSLTSYNHRGSDDNLVVYQLHGVYNQPLFLVAGQYIKSDWYTGSENTGEGYSVNFEVRPLFEHKLSIFGRYDNWNSEGKTYDREGYIYGVAYRMSKHLIWIVNGITVDYKQGEDYSKYMITAEVHY